MNKRPPAPGKDVLERYLLGEVSDNERAEVEQGYFADDELFEQLVEAENDLVDSYIQDTLTPTERKRFEERFLTSDSAVERVEFARALQRKSAARWGRRPAILPARTGLRRFAIAASIAVVVFSAAWLIFSSQQRRESLTESRPQASRQQQPGPATPLQAQTQPPPLQPESQQQTPAATARQTALVTVLLTPGGTREGKAAPPLVLRPAPQWVRVELVLEDDHYDSYTAELQDVEGRALWKEESLRAKTTQSGSTVDLNVPAKLLPPGDYVVILQGIRRGRASEINNYTFTVVALPARR